MDFPARPPNLVHPATARLVEEALGARPVSVLKAAKMLAVFADAAEVVAVQPNFAKVKDLEADGIVITARAPGSEQAVDFISRYFAPHAGIDEDPVTGSAHCMLAPYWSEQLGKVSLIGRQVSKRGGEMHCKVVADRVVLTGNATPYLEGRITVPHQKRDA